MDPATAVGPLQEFVKCAAVPAARHLGYMLRYKKNFDELKSMVDNKLIPLETDLKAKVDSAQRGGEKVINVMEDWLQEAKVAKDETSKLNDGASQITSCFTGWFSQRYHLGKEASKKIVGVSDILKDGRDLLNQPIAMIPRLQLAPDDCSTVFASQQSAKRRIIEALTNNEVNMVGVYGMGGVGKTTLLDQIRRHAKEANLFDDVVMVTVSQNPRLEDIQTEIAEKLGKELKEKNVSARAGRLYERLKQAKLLIILDDMWEELKLKDIGIPRDCKVVMTTRKLDLCIQMNAQISIEVDILAENESWDLFCQVFSKALNSNNIQSLAKMVVGECKGLPLAIVVLAKALKPQKQELWAIALKQMKKSIYDGMSPVLSSIRLSYDHLKSKDAKFFFLLCCLFPEDWKISMDEMLVYAVGEDILGDMDTLAEARDRMLQLVEKLISSSLLLKYDESRFTLHDIVRDVAISIAKENGNDFGVQAGMGLREWPTLSKMSTILRLSLISNNIIVLPDQLCCPRLITLSLRRNTDLQKVPTEFFTEMTALTTLDLSHTGISSLPQSLSSLTNLRTLNLEGCYSLVELSMLGCLRNLQILNLSSCKIKSLPEEFKLLTHLKLLNLSRNDKLEMIPPNVISSLNRLEEFYIDRFTDWETEGMEERKKACLSELSSLTRLSTLELRTKDVSLVYKDPPFHWKNLLKFKIAVPDRYPFWSNYSNTLNIKLVDDKKVIAEWVRVLWERTDELSLEDGWERSSITNVIPRLHSNFNNLKSLILVGCKKMEYVVQLEEIGDEAIFTELEKLELFHCNTKAICSSGPLPNGFLDKLKVVYVFDCEFVNVIPGELLVNLRNLESVTLSSCSKGEVLFDSKEGHASMLSKLEKMKLNHLLQLRTIWKGFSSETILPNLKIVEISSCKKLRYIIPVFMANNLQQLEELRIDRCDEMVHIFGSEEDEEEENNEISSFSQPPVIRAVLTRLKRLFLFTNPRLSGFCSHRSVIFSFPSLEDVIIESCDDLRKVPFGPDYAPKLEDLNSENLKRVDVSGCPKLRYLFPVSMANNLQQLEELEIRDCDEMVHIFGSEEDDINVAINLPQPVLFFNLRCLEIQQCASLKYLLSVRMARRLLQIEELKISNCPKIEELFAQCGDEEGKDIKVVFPQLKFIELECLESLSMFCSQHSVIFAFPSLNKVTIKSCPSLRTVPLGQDNAPKLADLDSDKLWQWGDSLEVEDVQVRVTKKASLLERVRLRTYDPPQTLHWRQPRTLGKPKMCRLKN